MENLQTVLTGEAIAERARQIGVPLSKLAAEAGLAKSTPYRNRDNARTRTLRAMQRALERRERALLEHLSALHGDEDAQ